MTNEYPKIESYIIASSVSKRDGIGIEIYSDKEIILEIFRDDIKKKKEVTLYAQDLELGLVEQAILLFKREILQAYQD